MTARQHRTDLLNRATSDAALRSLDPAANVDRHLAGSAPAQETLARILATDPAADHSVTPLLRARIARSHPRRWVLAASALVGVGALVLAPSMLGGQTAFASWSATAQAVAPAEAAVAGQDCKTHWGGPGGTGPGSDGKVVENADPVLVERRGAWTFVLLQGAGGFEATCLIKDKSDEDGYTGGGATSTYDTAPVAPDTAAIHSFGTTGDDQSSYSDSTGRVGSEVASVVINTPQQGAVKATIHSGYFAAWWPGPGIVHGKEPRPYPTYTLVLKDGTTKADLPLTQLWDGSR